MAKRKDQTAAPVKAAADQHKSGFMLRLPESHRATLLLLKKKNRRSMTEEVKIALEEHYKREGVEHDGSASPADVK